MFTDRYIKFPCEIFSKTHEDEALNDNTGIETFIKINPFDISRYHPTNYGDDPDTLDGVKVIFKDGLCVVLPLMVEDFEKQLNAFVK